MSLYAPASSVGWLDLDAAASDRVATLIRALEEPGTQDVLGLGTIRDALAARLSPGTSTIQTRLRYFIFLPWIFEGLEQQRVAPAEFARRLREAEARLIDSLRHIGPNNGVIGYAAGRQLKRLPSEIYWGGLGSWGIRRLEISLREYGQLAGAFGSTRSDRDDDGSITTRTASMWAGMPEPPSAFLKDELTFDLTSDEAAFLVDHIRQRHPASLLAFLCGRSEPIEAALPWELPTEGLSPELKEDLLHAQCFSELTVGPQIVYNLLLARRARAELGWDTEALERSELDHLAEWVDLIGQRYEALKAWVGDLPRFWAYLGGIAVISPWTREFISWMVNYAMSNPAGFADDAGVQARIKEREFRLKSTRARLGRREPLEAWNGQPFGGQLSYRWPITKSYLADIAAALK